MSLKVSFTERNLVWEGLRWLALSEQGQVVLVPSPTHENGKLKNMHPIPSVRYPRDV